MFRRTIAAAAAGSAAGAVLGTLALALASSRILQGGLDVPTLDSGEIGAVFAVGQAGLYLFVIVAGTVAGAILGMIGYAVGTQSDPASRRYRMGPVAILGALIGGPTAFAAARAAVGLAGDIADKTVAIPVFRAAVVAMVVGAITGLLIGVAIERLARPETLGLGGVAAPHSLGHFIREAVAAVGIPAIGIAVAAVLVFGLSRVLLEADKTTGLIVFGGVATLVLLGTAFLAAHPPKRRD